MKPLTPTYAGSALRVLMGSLAVRISPKMRPLIFFTCNFVHFLINGMSKVTKSPAVLLPLRLLGYLENFRIHLPVNSLLHILCHRFRIAERLEVPEQLLRSVLRIGIDSCQKSIGASQAVWRTWSPRKRYTAQI